MAIVLCAKNIQQPLRFWEGFLTAEIEAFCGRVKNGRFWCAVRLQLRSGSIPKFQLLNALISLARKCFKYMGDDMTVTVGKISALEWRASADYLDAIFTTNRQLR